MVDASEVFDSLSLDNDVDGGAAVTVWEGMVETEVEVRLRVWVDFEREPREEQVISIVGALWLIQVKGSMSMVP